MEVSKKQNDYRISKILEILLRQFGKFIIFLRPLHKYRKFVFYTDLQSICDLVPPHPTPPPLTRSCGAAPTGLLASSLGGSLCQGGRELCGKYSFDYYFFESELVLLVQSLYFWARKYFQKS